MTEAQWMRQCSKHLSHIEGRLMEDSYLGHEVVRQMMSVIEAFLPPPCGDMGWFLRKSQDIAVRALRQLVRVYMGNHEALGEFTMRAMVIVRLYVEEAFHRTLLSIEDPVRKRGLCSLITTMRSIEVHMLDAQLMSLGVWITLHEEAVRHIAMSVRRYETHGVRSGLESLPSFTAALCHADLRVEIMSLLSVRVMPGMNVMTEDEVRCLIAANGGEVGEDQQIVARQVSLFAGIWD